MPSAPLPSPHEIVRSERIRSIREQWLALKPPPRLSLEIGSGHGHFLTAYAKAHPKRFYLGIDIILDRLQRSERKRNRAALANIAFLRAEASEFLAALPAEFSIEEVFILFPDPWPKRRHHKHRLLQADFLTRLAKRCEPGARVYFRTDHREYFEAAVVVFSHHPDWRISGEPAWPFELETVFQARAEAFDSLVAVRA